ncbi:uncharacterized protein [Haliotis asinina]|uniref:uncharacterized protein n=1 Tax=Haliotis asinina TaxID=109174 RepID=UPI0035321345
MESLTSALSLVRKDCFMASIDLKDAYYTVPVHRDHQKYLKFFWIGQLYQFTVMPNGLSCAPRYFTKLLRVPFSYLRSRGHTNVGYIDDSFIVGDSQRECAEFVSETAELFTNLGFVLHSGKSVLIPTQELTFLGFVINSSSMTVSPAPSKALHFRRLDNGKSRSLRIANGNFDSVVVLNADQRADLQWWVTNVCIASKPISVQPPSVALTSDASEIGWGATRGTQSTGGRWSRDETVQHINYLELLAAFLALRTFCSTERKCHIRVRMDNTTAHTEDSRPESGGGPGQRTASSSIVADSAMVSPTPQTTHPSTSRPSASIPDTPPSSKRVYETSTQQNETCSVSCIRQSLTRRGVSDRAACVILQSWRKSTTNQYSTYIRRWIEFSNKREIDTLCPSVSEVLDFLAELYELHNLGYSALNTARSALSSFITIDSATLGSHPLINRFMKGVFQARPSLPRNTVTWDTSVVLNYLKTLVPLKDLSLKLLTLKAVALVALLTGQRLQTVHLLDIRDISLSDSCCRIRVGSLLKQSKPGVHQAELTLPAYSQDSSLCIVTVLREYLVKTAPLRDGANQLFISYARPFKAVSKDTVSRWIRQVLQSSGVDMTIFTPHSTRMASTSAALRNFVPLHTILKTAGWSSSATFSKFYDKPVTDSSFSLALLNNS